MFLRCIVQWTKTLNIIQNSKDVNRRIGELCPINFTTSSQSREMGTRLWLADCPDLSLGGIATIRGRIFIMWCGVDSCSHYFLPFHKLTLLFFFFSLCDTGFNECFNSNWCVLNSCFTSLSMLSFRKSCGGPSIDLSKFNSSGFFHPINPQKLIKLLSLADLFFFGSNVGLDSNLPGEGDYLEITGGEVKNGGPTF